jgi:hypothetical protein
MYSRKKKHPKESSSEPQPFTENDIRGSVTIYYEGKGQVTLVPALGLIDRHIQTIQWTLVDGTVDQGAKVKFADPGIIFRPGDSKSETHDWPGELPVRVNDWQWSACANWAVPAGGAAQKYAYDISVIDFTSGDAVHYIIQERHDTQRQLIDPDMENQPRP